MVTHELIHTSHMNIDSSVTHATIQNWCLVFSRQRYGNPTASQGQIQLF